MKVWKQQFFTFLAVSGIYLGILALAFPEQLIPTNLLSIGVTFGVFCLSSLVMTVGGSGAPDSKVQKFVLGTTVQMLAALFFIAICRFVVPDFFRGMAYHFLILFGCFLAIQGLFMIRSVRSKK